MALTKEEQETLDALTKKASEPDTPARGENISVIVDLADPDAVRRAKKLGYLPEDFEDDDAGDGEGEDGEDGEGEEGEDGEGGKKKDPAPKRRLTGADRLMGARDEQ